MVGGGLVPQLGMTLPSHFIHFTASSGTDLLLLRVVHKFALEETSNSTAASSAAVAGHGNFHTKCRWVVVESIDAAVDACACLSGLY